MPRCPQRKIGIGGERLSLTSPPTPPGMRVCTRRFERLRWPSSAQAWSSQSLKIGHREHAVERAGTVPPPATTIGRHRSRNIIRRSQRFEFSPDGSTASPLFELQGSHAVTQPNVEPSPHPRRLRETEVGLPAQQVRSQPLNHLSRRASGIAPRALPNPVLEARLSPAWWWPA